MTGHLSVRDRWRIISLYFDQNVLPSQIAVIIDCSISTVRRILRLYDETGDVTERKRRGRPSLSDTERTKVHIKIHKLLRVYTLSIGIISFDVFL